MRELADLVLDHIPPVGPDEGGVGLVNDQGGPIGFGEHGHATRSEQSGELAHYCAGVVWVLQHPVGVDGIEGAGRESEPACLASDGPRSAGGGRWPVERRGSRSGRGQARRRSQSVPLRWHRRLDRSLDRSQDRNAVPSP